MDSQYSQFKYSLPELPHRYGPRVHLLADPLLLSELATLCAFQTTQPLINELVTRLYSSLLPYVVNREFPLRTLELKTRMAEHHPEAEYRGPAVDPETPVVSVNLARAGTLPSHVCYSALNYLINPQRVRQDHISIGRSTDAEDRVTGSKVSGHKIGGRVDGAIVLFPDPMGATGATIIEAMRLYKGLGQALRYVALHCIVTPEYIRAVHREHPELEIYAIRLDRGLSPADVLATVPGTNWDRERGLNAKSYIVPGGGGFGEILNNAFV